MTTDTSLTYTTPVSSISNARSIAIALLLGDLLGAVLCLEVFHFVRLGNVLNLFSVALWSTTIAMVVGFYLADAYRPDLRLAGLWAPARTFVACLFVSALLAAFSYLLDGKSFSTFAWRSILLPGLGLFTVWAVVLRIIAGHWATSQAKQSACLFLGSEATALQFEQDFMEWNPLAKLVVLLNTSDSTHQPTTEITHYSGPISDLSRLTSNLWSGVVVAPKLELSPSMIQQLMQLRLQGTPVYNLPDFYEMLWQKLPSALLQDTWFAFGSGFHLATNRTNLKLKRLVDLCSVGILLLLLSPIMAIAALAIRLESPGPIFYSQWRSGLNGEQFQVFKFRSMYQDAEKQGAQWAKQRDPRVTQVGYWLRLVRIDELPQLWNVLRGDMSLIGPRPERPEFDYRLSAEIPYYKLRYLVKPGITGWAQVLYPYGASVEDAYEKLSYDLYYIKNYSIWLDFAIALKTIRVVLLGKGR